MNVQDITGKYVHAGPIAGMKSKVISDGHAPWAHGGAYESEEYRPDKKTVGGLNRDNRGMMAAGGQIRSQVRGNQSSFMQEILGNQEVEATYNPKPITTTQASYLQPPETSKVSAPTFVQRYEPTDPIS